jgi:DNA-binding SARP family transcriptional activator
MGQELRVRVLGTTELAVDGRPLAGLASAKATALLVYLAVTGTAQSRSALAGLLWSDLPEATARANLRLALTKLRRALPAQLLVTRQTVALDRPGRSGSTRSRSSGWPPPSRRVRSCWPRPGCVAGSS